MASASRERRLGAGFARALPRRPRRLYAGEVSRPLRIQFPGALLHVGARGNRRATVYHDDQDYGLFEALFRRVLDDLGWSCHVYCLMPNHYHLVIQLRDANLSLGMQHLNGRYGQLYNERYGLTGHVFQGRFWSEVIETDEHYERVCPYVYENPERAGLCTPAGPWPWRGGKVAPKDASGV
jgi:putative transposase